MKCPALQWLFVCPIFVMAVLAFLVGPVQAVVVHPYGEDYATQDRILIDESLVWHELGDLFPANELIQSTSAETNYQPCPENPDSAQIPNILVTMTNQSGIDWYNVHYVADPDTFLQNDDGLIGNVGLQDAQLAFRIDNLGVNTPLIYESMSYDNIFQAGEVWQFVIQDYFNLQGLPATPFGSIGIASLSYLANDPNGMSSGSIIASAVPEPATLAIWSLFGACGAAVAARRRRRK